MSTKETEIKFKSGRSEKAIHGTMKAEVDGAAKEFAAFFFIEESNGISAAFGKREGDYVSVSNIEGYPLVSYNVEGASIPWDTDGRMLDIKKDSFRDRYFGSFTAKFSASVPPGIPKAVSGIFEVWED